MRDGSEDPDTARGLRERTLSAERPGVEPGRQAQETRSRGCRPETSEALLGP